MDIIKKGIYHPKWQLRELTIYCIVHHAAATTYSFEQCRELHLNKGWWDIGYHLYIQKDGKVYEGRPLDVIGAHTQGYNNNSIGICMEGNFIIERLGSLQKLKLIDSFNYVVEKYPKIKIAPHSYFNNNTCPGDIRLVDILAQVDYVKKPKKDEVAITELSARVEKLEKTIERLISVLQGRKYIN